MAISEGKYLSVRNPAMSILRPLSPIAQTNSAGSNQMPLWMGWVGSWSQMELVSSDGSVISVISEEESDMMMRLCLGREGDMPQTSVVSDESVISEVQDMMVFGGCAK